MTPRSATQSCKQPSITTDTDSLCTPLIAAAHSSRLFIVLEQQRRSTGSIPLELHSTQPLPPTAKEISLSSAHGPSISVCDGADGSAPRVLVTLI